MFFDLFLYSVTVQAKNLYPDENADRGVKIHQLHHLEEKHPNTISLRFADTTCTSSVIHEDSDALGTPISADRTPLCSCLSPIQSHPFGLILRAFPNAQLNGSSPLPVDIDAGRLVV